MFAKGKKIRMPLQFAEDYSYGKHVSIWIRHGKQDKMKIVVLNRMSNTF